MISFLAALFPLALISAPIFVLGVSIAKDSKHSLVRSSHLSRIGKNYVFKKLTQFCELVQNGKFTRENGLSDLFFKTKNGVTVSIFNRHGEDYVHVVMSLHHEMIFNFYRYHDGRIKIIEFQKGDFLEGNDVEHFSNQLKSAFQNLLSTKKEKESYDSIFFNEKKPLNKEETQEKVSFLKEINQLIKNQPLLSNDLKQIIETVNFLDTYLDSFDIEKKHEYQSLISHKLVMLLQSYNSFSKEEQIEKQEQLKEAIFSIQNRLHDYMIINENKHKLENEFMFEKAIRLVKK